MRVCHPRSRLGETTTRLFVDTRRDSARGKQTGLRFICACSQHPHPMEFKHKPTQAGSCRSTKMGRAIDQLQLVARLAKGILVIPVRSPGAVASGTFAAPPHCSSTKTELIVKRVGKKHRPSSRPFPISHVYAATLDASVSSIPRGVSLPIPATRSEMHDALPWYPFFCFCLVLGCSHVIYSPLIILQIRRPTRRSSTHAPLPSRSPCDYARHWQ